MVKNKLKILIFGGNGLVGYNFFRNLSYDFNVKTTLKGKFDDYKNLKYFTKNNSFYEVNLNNFDNVKYIIKNFNPNFVINCAGITKHRINTYKEDEVIRINTLLPFEIYNQCKKIRCKFIHLSTDCVFSGRRGLYSEDDIPDAKDLYGKTKIEGELKNYFGALTIRKSTLGFEIGEKKYGLLEWFLSQKGEISGYKNAIFSGITTNELAEIIRFIILNKPRMSGLLHISGEPIDKYSLLKKINSKFKKNILINKNEDFFVDRSLNNLKFKKNINYNIPSWDNMILNLYNSIEP